MARQNNACDVSNNYDNGRGRAYRDPAGYYGSDAAEDDYYHHYGRHSDGYVRYQNDVAADARYYSCKAQQFLHRRRPDLARPAGGPIVFVAR